MPPRIPKSKGWQLVGLPAQDNKSTDYAHGTVSKILKRRLSNPNRHLVDHLRHLPGMIAFCLAFAVVTDKNHLQPCGMNDKIG